MIFRGHTRIPRRCSYHNRYIFNVLTLLNLTLVLSLISHSIDFLFKVHHVVCLGTLWKAQLFAVSKVHSQIIIRVLELAFIANVIQVFFFNNTEFGRSTHWAFAGVLWCKSYPCWLQISIKAIFSHKWARLFYFFLLAWESKLVILEEILILLLLLNVCW